MNILSRQTHPAIKVIFAYYCLFVVAVILQLSLLEKSILNSLITKIDYYIFLAIYLALVVCIVLRKHRATLVILVLSEIRCIASHFIYSSHGFSIDYTATDMAMSIAYSLVGWLMVFHIFLKSPIVKKYYSGQPSLETDPETGKRRLNLYNLLPKKYLIGGIGLLIVLKAPSVNESFERISGHQQSLDEKGFIIDGDVEISIIENKDGTLEFAWEGRPVSFIRITQGPLSDMAGRDPVWASAALEDGKNCIESPVHYANIDNECADSLEPEKLVPGVVYTVYIARYYGPLSKSEPVTGWALREFTID